MLAGKMPYCKFILPTAPMQPVTLNGGMRMNSWYDLVGLDERANENCKGIDESRAMLANILKTEHATTGLPYSRMVLAGFSQGGALSLFTGLQLPPEQKLAAVCVLSSYLPAANQFKVTPGFEDVPVWHGQ
jgi:lysophospholipase-2